MGGCTYWTDVGGWVGGMHTLVMAAVSVVLPWSTCPMVPMFKWGLVRLKTVERDLMACCLAVYEGNMGGWVGGWVGMGGAWFKGRHTGA